MIVARTAFPPRELKGKRVAVPGKMTTAFLLAQLFEPEIEPIFVPFDQIQTGVAKGDFDAGVLIHEGQLTYSHDGLKKIADLGEWWHAETGLPLPLGGNGIRRALDTKTIRQVARLLRASIEYSLAHREQALEYAIQFSRGLDAPTADRFVAMYVNEWTLDYGESGRKAVQLLLDRGFEKGILPRRVEAQFVD
jgi:1,4-dihydroxy-6-naphthoate synthase